MRGIVFFVLLGLAAGLSGCASDATSSQPWNQQQSWEQGGALGPALGR